LEEEEIWKSKVSILKDGRNVSVECECCKEHELKIANLEKLTTNASKIKNVENPNFKKKIQITSSKLLRIKIKELSGYG